MSNYGSSDYYSSQPGFPDQPDSNLFNDQQPVVYGNFWERFAAALIDVALLWIVGYIVGKITGVDEMSTFVATQEGLSAQYITYYSSATPWINLVIGWLYSAIMESSSSQATLGKMALGLKVTNLEGRRISFLKATGRHFGKLLSTIILFIGYLMMLWDDRKQTLHDKLAGTLVVKK